MNKHPHHNLWLHDDRELETILGCPITERITVHEWPISCVQQLRLADGRRIIYKSQYGASVEPEFYRKARSPLMVPARTIWESEGHSCMFIDFVDAPQLQDLELREEEAAHIGEDLVARIAEIEGDPPCYIDISDTAKWLQLVESTLSDLQNLVDEGRFQQVTSEAVRALDRCARNSSILEAIAMDSGLIHGDLGGDNVFRCGDGFKVIDWQRPIRGPREFNLFNVIGDCGFDPLKYVHRGIAGVSAFLGVRWFTECKKLWIPDGRSYDGYIAQTAQSMERSFTTHTG